VRPAVQVVEEQIAAYNARDLQRFVRTYADDIEVYRPPARDPVIRGAAALAEFYGEKRFCHVGLRAEILDRLATGNLVCDHERVHGLPGGTVDVFATYEVTDGRIRRVWLFAPSGD
jgi:hypothetical protein